MPQLKITHCFSVPLSRIESLEY